MKDIEDGLIVIELHSTSIQFDRAGSSFYPRGIFFLNHIFCLTLYQKVKGMSEVADKVDQTFVDLSLAIQNVGIVENYSTVHLNEVRIAAIYLSAAVLDCLRGLMEWVDACSIF